MTYDGLNLISEAILMQMAPKPEEAQALQAYEGPVDELSEPERFLLALSCVPRLQDKIGALTLMQQFDVSCLPSTAAPSLPLLCVLFGCPCGIG